MNESPKPLKHSVGKPFWIGCLVGPILFLILLAALNVFHDSFTFWFSAAIAVIVFAPVGGMAFQATHDLFVARQLRQLHLWDYLAFAAIVAALVTAGMALFYAPDKKSNVDMFQNRNFDIAEAFIALLLIIYAISKNLARLLSRQFYLLFQQLWIAIFITIGLSVACGVIYKLTKLDFSWIMIIGTAIWAAIDSSKIQLKRYKSGISYGPIILFLGFVFLWVIVFPWYFVVRYKIKNGMAVLKDSAV